MQNWFECKAKYVKLDNDGKERKVNEPYLVDAVSVTDAETRLIEQLKTMIRGEFAVGKVAESNIVEIFPHKTGQWWYKAKIQTVVIDEHLGKEKKINNYFLVAADDIKQALQRLEEGLGYLLVPYTTASIALSAIVDVFPYFGDNKAIPSNLIPIEEAKNRVLGEVGTERRDNYEKELEEVYNSEEDEPDDLIDSDNDSEEEESE